MNGNEELCAGPAPVEDLHRADTHVRIAGFGGQGVVLAGVLLGLGAVEDGLHAVQNQSYGAEARGGAARSEVLISHEPIIYPEVITPDITVALSQVALDRYCADLEHDGILILDAGLVSRVPADAGYRVLGGEFAQVASRELGRALVANMVMLGFLVAATGIVSRPAVRRAVACGVPAGTEDLNLRAFDRGATLASGLARRA